MQDLSKSLHGCTVKKKIDLVSQQRTSQNEQLSHHLARLNTCSPFVGNSNAAQTFQRMMDRTVSNLEAVFAYMKDSWVGSSDKQTYLIHLE
jgi:hypothetical protein